jgi:transcriptional regulator with XRE-family HTH domain
MQETEISFSHRLKELRGSKTQSAIAAELQVNQQTYARWELGDRQPKLQDLASIALHFGVSADWLLGVASPHSVSKKHVSMGEKLEAYEAVCHECAEKDTEIKKKQAHIDRLERIIDKLTK